MARAEGAFDITNFSTQDPHDDRDGVCLATAHISKVFHGSLPGTSETDILTVPTDRPAAYAGIERFEGDLAGRKAWSGVDVHGPRGGLRGVGDIHRTGGPGQSA
jgi:hypothetical protein